MNGNDAIRRHRDDADLRRQLEADLPEVASEPWARHVWHRDPRFAEYIPKGTGPVSDIAMSGSYLARRYLWDHFEALGAVVAVQAALSLPVAVSDYVEGISGQKGHRLAVLLARTGLNGRDPITGVEAARILGVSPQRMHQIVGQLHRNRDRAIPEAGVWMPQVDEAERHGWPEGYTAAGVDVTGEFFDSGRA